MLRAGDAGAVLVRDFQHRVAGLIVALGMASAGAGPVRGERMLGIVHGRLTHLDPLTLGALGPALALGEYHHAWSFSPDRSRLAVAISAPSARGRIGIRVVDLARMEVAYDVSTGIAAEVLGWLTPNRLIGGLQTGEVIVVDTTAGAILHQSRLPLPLGVHKQRAVPANGGLVLFVVSRSRAGPSYLAVADVEGGLRVASLPGDRSEAGAGEPAFAVDADGKRAFVVEPRGRATEVDLTTMRVRSHRLAAPLRVACPPALANAKSGNTECSSFRRAAWLGSGRMAFFGADTVVGRSGVVTNLPGGVSVIDTTRWTAWTVENASRAKLAGDTLMVYGGRSGTEEEIGVGLRGYGLDGRERFHVFGSDHVYAVELGNGYAYALSSSTLRIVDVASGRIVRELPALASLELLR
jgi:hypothetical protein